ncbi:aspartate/glutamate racemase family protein [Ulvibacterium sp.]|uniref:aspartate/glutamate racemase family protein n=1 Tax=Ulvibacterium sp. TaxID=2665914 RepID=UPI0026158F92|nr:aspartate/glutamate racemase family protein [Ulvibacterium sp.]
MKTIGLIGGMSWESSKIYYEYTNTMVKERLGGSHSAKSIMTSVDFSEIEELTFKGNWNKIGDLMANHAVKLEKAGADMTLLCTNTIHLVSDRITQSTAIPFLHIADATGEAIQAKGLKKIALLGTKFTMEKDFYTKILEDTYGLEVIIPSEQERQAVHTIIYNELVKGRFMESSKQICIQIIEGLTKKGAQGVILGCTELPLLISELDVAIPTFNTTRIHAEKAVDFALTDS